MPFDCSCTSSSSGMCLFLPDSSRFSATPVEQPSKKVIDQATRSLIDRLLLERISLAGIARAAKVSEQWLQTYVNEKYARVPRQVQVAPKKRGG